MKTCSWCGRVGTRRYRYLAHPLAEKNQWWLCTNYNACMTRAGKRDDRLWKERNVRTHDR